MKILTIILLSLIAITVQAQNILVGFRANTPRAYAQQVLRENLIRELEGIDVYVARREASTGLARNPHIEFIEDDQVVAPALVPNDTYYDNVNAWSLQKTQAPQAWDITTGSSSIVIAILDSGLESSHPDIVANAIAGYNVYDNNADTTAVGSHGTAVAGTAAAVTNNGIGVAAVCWTCKIMPIRVTDASGYSSYSLLSDGLNWARQHGAKIANISFYAPLSKTLSRAAKSFYNAGGLVVRSEGNTGGTDNVANDLYVIDVGGTDQSDVIYSWSTRGPNMDLVAPGNVATTCLNGTYCTFTGTSASAPQVAAAIALIWSVNPAFTNAQVEGKLELNTDDLGIVGYDTTYGWGRLNLFKAVQ
jgi:thermitase